MSKLKNIFIKNKKHIFFLSLILIIILGVNWWQTTNKIRTLGDVGMHHFLFYSNKEAVLKYHQFPLWFDNMFSGTPLFANSQSDTLLSYALPFMLTLPTRTALNASMLFGAFLAALFMYILALNLGLKPRYAFIVAIVWSVGVSNGKYIGSWAERYKVLVFIPLTFFLFMRSFKSKSWFKYAVLAGISLALQFHGDGIDFFLFSLVIFGFYFLYMLIGKNLKKRIIKLALIGLISSFIFLGLVAIKLLPMLEFGKVSSKETGFDFKESVGTVARGKYLFQLHYKEFGVVAIILALFALFSIRKKYVLFSYLILLVGYLIITGSPFYHIIWKFVPGFSATHHVARNSFIIVFGLAILAGFGARNIFSKFKLKHKKIIYIILIVLLVADISFSLYNYRTKSAGKYATYFGPTYEEMIAQNELLQYLSKQPGIFRIENIGASGHSGLTMVYLTPLNLSRLYGATSLWIPEYFNVHLSVAHQSPAKFWGMLNAKYVYYKDLVNITGFRFLRKFNECSTCIEDPLQDQGISGPYLYLNELYLPRAYMADYSIAVIGDKNAVDQVTYSLMLNGNFDPSNSVIVMLYGSVNDYNIDLLKRFNAIILTQGSIDQNSGLILKQYVDLGGILMPNVVEGKTGISDEEINSLLSSFKGDYNNVKEVNITYYSPNKRIMRLDGERGWMVLAEKFHMFEGWEPKINNVKKPIYRANGMNSAVYLEGESGELRFKYSPKSFRRGLTISLITLFLIVIFFIGYYIRNKSTIKQSIGTKPLNK